MTKDQVIPLIDVSVTKLAKKFSRKYRGISFDDLYQEGILGALLAFHRYDSSVSSIKTFFLTRAAGAMLDYMRSSGSTVKVTRADQHSPDKKLIFSIHSKVMSKDQTSDKELCSFLVCKDTERCLDTPEEMFKDVAKQCNTGLSPKDLELLALCFPGDGRDGLPFRHIAKRLGWSAQHIGDYYKNLISRLKESANDRR